VERSRSEPVRVIKGFFSRFAAIANRDDFIGQRAGAIGADRFASAADTAARASSSSEREQ
jgi:hypothetical protein